MDEFQQIAINEEVKLKTDSAVMHESGSLKIWIRKQMNFIELFSGNNFDARQKNPPKNAVWKRWLVSEETVPLVCLPHVPDKSVQVVFNEPLVVPEGKNIMFFYWLPAWISVRIGKQRSMALGEFPTQPLSHSWVGNFFDGELVYEDFPSIHIKPEPHTDPHMFICPVEVRNAGYESLLLEKLVIRVNNLSVYSDAKNFWLGKMTFEYGKDSQLADVRMANALPKELGKFTLVQKAVSHDKKSILLKTFTPIRMKNTLILPNK
ncbi:MAG: hypothetical protein JXR65_05610 [Bacteroidales bacterium]|nr:hypothetical protein [Bacteroidales bacterium]